MVEISKGFVPKNTSNSTTWVVQNFRAWSTARNIKFPDDPVPDDILSTNDTVSLNKWLSFYVLETRNASGEAYPPSTIYQLLSGLLRSIRTENPECPNFIDKKNLSFRKLHGTLNSLFRSLKESGLAEIISKPEENKLWASGIMGLESPSETTKVFYVRLHPEDRGSYALNSAQFERKRDPDHYIYTENCSKNHAGTFKQLHVTNKVVPVYCTCTDENTPLTNKTRCHVHLLDTYISRLPESVIAEQGPFYLRPLQTKLLASKSPWFCQVPVGKNTLQSKLKKMCLEAGIEGRKTNHSLRATGASELYVANVPEKIIQERTGHHSLAALRMYERTTEDQHRTASSILASSSQCNFQQVHSNIQHKVDMHVQPSSSG